MFLNRSLAVRVSHDQLSRCPLSHETKCPFYPSETGPHALVDWPPLFACEVNLLGQHGGDTRDLFLLVHVSVGGVRLELVGHDLIDTCHHGQEVQSLAMLHQDFGQCLHEPGAIGRVSPGVVT